MDLSSIKTPSKRRRVDTWYQGREWWNSLTYRWATEPGGFWTHRRYIQPGKRTGRLMHGGAPAGAHNLHITISPLNMI